MLDSSHASFGASGNRVLYSSDSLLSGGSSILILEGESWMASQFLSSDSYVIGNMRTDARHLRISTVGTHELMLESGLTVSPSVSMGVREDGRQGESFFGMKMGGGMGFANPIGYEISTRCEMLYSGSSQIQEWGLSGQMSCDAGCDGLGVLVNVTPVWGRTMLDADSAFWGDRVLVDDFDSSMHASGVQINAEIGYGLNAREELWLVKPYGGILLSETQDDKYHIGTKLTVDSGFELELKGSRTHDGNGTENSGINLEGRASW